MRIASVLVAAMCWLSAYGIVSEEVVVVNASEGSVLAGTLTLPEGKARAALVLATGSGAQDRDETVYGHKPFKAIAERLTERGYAVLRLDDRGVGGSTGATSTATTRNFVSDISRAVEWVDSTLRVPVGVLGHSEGGQIAYCVAADEPRCRFIVTLAAPAWRGDSLIMAQCRALSVGAFGRWDGERYQRTILDIAMSAMPPESAQFAVMSELSQALGDASRMPQMQEYIREQARIVLVPWYREFLRFDPTSTIERVRVPWLALNGDKDTQVTSENLATIVELCPMAKAVLLEGHNHLFQHAVTGLPNEYDQIEEDISEETLTTIADWLDELEL